MRSSRCRVFESPLQGIGGTATTITTPSSRQYVSLARQRLSDSSVDTHVTRATQTLDEGLQVLSFAESRELLLADGTWTWLCNGDLLTKVAKLVRDGKLVWENQRRGRAPDAELGAILATKTR